MRQANCTVLPDLASASTAPRLERQPRKIHFLRKIRDRLASSIKNFKTSSNIMKLWNFHAVGHLDQAALLALLVLFVQSWFRHIHWFYPCHSLKHSKWWRHKLYHT